MSSMCLDAMKRPRPTFTHTRQQGFGILAAMVVLVLLATMAAAVARLGWTQQTTFSQNMLAAKANQAARAGLEWGMYKAVKDNTWASCNTSQTLDLRTDTEMYVTVTCSYDSYSEGESAVGVASTVKVYKLVAVACNGSGSCPDNTAAVKPYYVERRMEAVLTN